MDRDGLLFEDIERRQKKKISSPLNLAYLFPGITTSQVEKVSSVPRDKFIAEIQNRVKVVPIEGKEDSYLYPIIKGEPYYLKKEQPPRDWQIEALLEWVRRDYKGVVEAMTGTGKTFLAIYAISLALRNGRKAIVLVPTIDLFDQWYSLLSAIFQGVNIGRLGNGHKNTLRSSTILISTVQSAASLGESILASEDEWEAWEGKEGEQEEPPKVLVVADECHNYGGDVFSLALLERYEWRLGLSATVGKLDFSYFRNVVYKVSYKEALSDKAISDFKVEFHRIALCDDSMDKYGQVTDELESVTISLSRMLNCPPAALFGRINDLVEPSSYLIFLKNRFLYLYGQQKNFLASNDDKFYHLESLIPTFAGKDRVLVFSQTVASANKAAALLQKKGLVAKSLHAQIPAAQRRDMLSQFKNGKIQVICAPRVLDEGVDVPDVDTAIVLSASRGQRQMIQRLGRIIRASSGKEAKLLVLTCADTIEDPAKGGYKSFVSAVNKVAQVSYMDYDHYASTREA